MSDCNKAGRSQRKSTGRRSSILKQRQDTCILSDVTEVIERTNSPFKRRVSFASTATVRTFETLPWRSYADDSGSSSANKTENDVFGPKPSLLVDAKPKKYPSVVPPDDGSTGESNNRDQSRDKEQNKTILFSEMDMSNCDLEITTNVSQLSNSWFDNNDSCFENNKKSGQNSMNNSDIESEPSVIFPWQNKATNSNEVEKTHIFLSSDDDMELTHYMADFPSMSEPGNIVPCKENFPKHLTGDHKMLDEMTDMEMTNVMETVSVPVPKRRSVLVDLTEEKNLTPIQEMSVSSFCGSDNNTSSQQKKGFDVSQVCTRLEAMESDKHLYNVNNKMDLTKSNSTRNETLSYDEDPEISFNFGRSVDPSPNISRINQNSKPFPFVSKQFRNSLTGESQSVEDSSFASGDRNTVFMGDMDISENEVSYLQKTYAAQDDNNDFKVEDRMGHESKATLFNMSMEMTNTHLVDDVFSHDSRMEVQDSPKSAIRVEEQQAIESPRASNKNEICQNSLKVTKGGTSIVLDDNRYEQKKDLVQNALDSTRDMEFRHCTDDTGRNSNRVQSETTIEISSSCQSRETGRPESAQMTVDNTEDMSFTCYIADSNYSGLEKTMTDFDIDKKESHSNEKTVFAGEMETTSVLSQHISEGKHSPQITMPSLNGDNVKSAPPQIARVESDSSRSEANSSIDVREEAGSLHVPALDNFLGSEEMSFHQSIMGDVDDNDSLQVSISLSEIAGMKSPKASNQESRPNIPSNADDYQQNQLTSIEGSKNQSVLDCKNTSVHPEIPPIQDKLQFENASFLGGVHSQSQEFNQSDVHSEDKEESLHDSISLSEIAGLKFPPKEIESKPTSQDNNCSFPSSKNETSLLGGHGHNMEKETFPISNVKSVATENCKESPKKSAQLSEQAKKKEALRKSISSEMMFPNLGSKSYMAKSFSQLSKQNTVRVAKPNHNHSEMEISSKNSHQTQEDGDCEMSRSAKKESRRNSQSRFEEMGLLSGFFEGEGLELEEVDCPNLEDHSYVDPPVDESVQEELVFSYMRSIIEIPGDEANETNSKTAVENCQEKLEFSEICQVMGIDCEAEQGQQIFPKVIPSTSISDKLSADIFVKPEVATLEDWNAKLKSEVSKQQQVVKEALEKFSINPPQIYTDIKRATVGQQGVSSIKSKIHEMARACKVSVRSRHNRQKADYLKELTSAHQKKQSQVERDLDTILSDIERVANVSAEIDKYMEEMNVFSQTNAEIHQLEKEKAAIESETCQVRSRCNKLDTEIDVLNETARNCLHKMKEDEDEELLLLDKISFMSCLSEWSLLKQTKSKLTFGFLSNTLILNVSFSDTKMPHQTISDISLRSRLSSKSTLWARISHQLLVSSLDKETLMRRFQNIDLLSLLLAHVSSLAGISRDLCTELKEIHTRHSLSADGLRIRIQLLSHDCHQSLEVAATLQPGTYLTHSLDWEANILYSKLLSLSVVDVLRQVVPGDRYISRCIEAVLSLMAR